MTTSRPPVTKEVLAKLKPGLNPGWKALRRGDIHAAREARERALRAQPAFTPPGPDDADAAWVRCRLCGVRKAPTPEGRFPEHDAFSGRCTGSGQFIVRWRQLEQAREEAAERRRAEMLIAMANDVLGVEL